MDKFNLQALGASSAKSKTQLHIVDIQGKDRILVQYKGSGLALVTMLVQALYQNSILVQMFRHAIIFYDSFKAQKPVDTASNEGV